MNRRKFFKSNALAGILLGMSGTSFAEEHAAPKTISIPEADGTTLTPGHFGQVDVSEEQLLKVGFSERDITPDVGMGYAGNYFPTYLTGFHDRCKVRAVVFDDGVMQVALVGTDTVSVPRSIVEAARKKIHERSGLYPEAVMIGAAHNHSGGPVTGETGLYDDASEFLQRLAYKESSVSDRGYFQLVTDQIVNAVCDAFENRSKALCGVGTGGEDKVAFSRRFYMKNGLTYTHPGQGNPDIVKIAGAVDPDVNVIGVWKPNGEFLGCIVNFTCHATTSPGSGSVSSANWIYYMERVIRGAMGADVPVVFLQGACGNVTQVDNLSPYKRQGGTQWAEFVGGRVGAEAVKVLLTMVPGAPLPLGSSSTVLQIKRRAPSAAHVKEAYEVVQHDFKTFDDQAKWLFAKETVLADYLIKKSPVVPVEVQAIQIGPAVFVSNPAELFCQAGLDIKKASRFPQTSVVSYANGKVGYVPTEDCFGPNGGGYETRLSSHTNLDITASSQIVSAGVSLISRLQPGVVPVPQKAASFCPSDAGIGSHEWSYGNLPPQVD
jgi:neutral ceramidase